MDLKADILDSLTSGKNVFLAGQSDSGKTYFAKNELLPFLRSQGLDISYFKDCNDVTGHGPAIVDEAEALQDRRFLEEKYPEEKPYYSETYVQRVNEWFERLTALSNPSVFIISRKDEEDVRNFAHTVKTTDWNGQQAVVFIFERN